MPIRMRRFTGLLALVLLCAASSVRSEAPPLRTPAPSAPARIDDAALLDALTFGITAEDLARMRAMGRDAWLAAQLHPPPGLRLPPEVQAASEPFREEAPFVERFSAFTDLLKALRPLPPGPERVKLSQEGGAMQAKAGERAVARVLLAALASPDQLRERMVWVWLNHFSVSQSKTHLRLLVGDYVETAIRPHALGRFRDLLGAVLRHPAMLEYLDNAKSVAQRRNENYARELLELHTLGVDGGYTQGDVEQLARILTGVGYGLKPAPVLTPDRQREYRRDGLFVFDPSLHDHGDKVLLGRTIKGRGLDEVDEALDILARHPATARHVSATIAQAILGDRPSKALAERLAQAFTESDGDIAHVVEALVRDPEFGASLGRAFKDPLRFVVSAVRLGYSDRPIRNPAHLQQWLKRLGQGLFGRTTPDGYSLDAAAWNGPGQMVARFETAEMLGSSAPGLFAAPATGASAPEAAKPAPPVLRNDFYATVLSGRLGARTLAALAQAKSPPEWNMLYLSSPEFMHGLAPQEARR